MFQKRQRVSRKNAKQLLIANLFLRTRFILKGDFLQMDFFCLDRRIFSILIYLQYTSKGDSSDLSLHPALFVASQEKFPWKSLLTCSKSNLLGSISHRSFFPEPLSSKDSPLPEPEPNPEPEPAARGDAPENPEPPSSSSHIGSCFNKTPSMYQRTLEMKMLVNIMNSSTALMFKI